MGRERLAQCGWRLLRNHARSYPRVGKTRGWIYTTRCRNRSRLHMILRLSGLEPLNITPEFGFAVIGERTNITGSPRFSKLILGGDFDGAIAVARQQVQGGANLLDVNMDEGMIDRKSVV